MCLCYRLCVAVELVLSVVFQDDMAFGLLFYEICQIFAGFVVPLCRLEYVGKSSAASALAAASDPDPASAALVSVFALFPPPQAARLITIVAASTTDNTFFILFSPFRTSRPPAGTLTSSCSLSIKPFFEQKNSANANKQL